MKKEHKHIILSIITFLLVVSIVNFVHAQESFPSAGEEVQKQIGINPEKLDPATIERDYLQKEWSKIITNSTVFGPTHKFFTNNPLVFKILFKEAYSFSLTFFLIVIFWVTIALVVEKTVRAMSWIKGWWFSGITGILAAVILAQSGLYTATANLVLNLIFSRENYWIRAILWAVFFVVIIVINYLGNAASAELKTLREAKEKAEVVQKLTKQEAFYKGTKEGQDIVK